MQNHETGGGHTIKNLISKIPWKIVWNVIKPIITIGMIWLIFKETKWNEIWTGLQKINIPIYLIGLISYNVILMLLYVWRWSVVLRGNGIIIPFLTLLRIQFIGVTAQTFMPSTFGADVVKFALINKKGQGAETLNSLFLGRVVGNLALILFAIPGAFIFTFNNGEIVRIILIVVLGLTVFGLLIAWRPFFDIDKFMKIKWMEKPGKFLKNLQTNMRFSLLTPMFIISILIQVFSGISFYLFMISAGIPVSFEKVLFIAPLIAAVTMLIPAMLGIGPREAGVLYFFSVEMGTKEMLGVFSVIINVAILIQVIFGLFFWIFLPKDINQRKINRL